MTDVVSSLKLKINGVVARVDGWTDNDRSRIAALQSSDAAKQIFLEDASSGQSAYAKVYKIYQGSDTSDNSNNTLVGTINIPLDKVVQSGKLVTVTSNVDSDNDAVTTADGKYIKLTLQNVADPLYINVHDLVDVYTATSQGTEVIVAIDGNHNITASIGTVPASKVSITDTNSFYTSTNADGALDEVATALSNMGITQVAIVNAFTSDASFANGRMEFAPATDNVAAV